MLQKLQLNNTDRSVAHFLPKSHGEDIFEMDPSYQRASVWTLDQRRALVKSLLMRIPIGAVLINHRGYETAKIYAVVDGKQRIETLRAFAEDGFTVPADWFDAEDVCETSYEEGQSMVGYSGLTRRGQRSFENCAVACLEAQVKGEQAEAEIFLLVNSSGTSQTEEDLRRAEVVAGR